MKPAILPQSGPARICLPHIVSNERKTFPLNNLLLHLIDTLSLPLDERGTRRALSDFADEAGFRYYAYLYLSGPESFAVSNYPRQWQKHYVQSGYLRVDPVVTNAKHGPPVFTWSAGMGRRLGRRVLTQFFSDAAQFGIVSGLSISVPVGFRNRMVFTLAGDSTVFESDQIVDPVTAAVAVTLIHARLNKMTGDTDLATDIRLSPREAECLRWYMEGVKIPEIAIMLNLSERTVRSYIHQATHKIGADNNRQAGIIAVKKGLI
ncbi:autoinducer binding domain-containing protein [Devosia sp. LjRoot3]|uniref:autoinducer binding domain-containing protein n=1 Tax=Devosia sp. LjRoot3 TaxID=3342319 RepID=UPI003ECDD402